MYSTSQHLFKLCHWSGSSYQIWWVLHEIYTMWHLLTVYHCTTCTGCGDCCWGYQWSYPETQEPLRCEIGGVQWWTHQSIGWRPAEETDPSTPSAFFTRWTCYSHSLHLWSTCVHWHTYIILTDYAPWCHCCAWPRMAVLNSSNKCDLSCHALEMKKLHVLVRMNSIAYLNV